MDDMDDMNVSVTIIGGGPNGMAMAIALARQGVRSRVVERGSSITDHPKARGMWTRAMEIFRQWGVYEPIRAQGLPDASDRIVILDRLDDVIAETAPEPFKDESPARKSIVSQDVVEQELAARVLDFPEIDMRRNCEFLSSEEARDGVVLRVRDTSTGEESSWSSTYLIGAFGPNRTLEQFFSIEYDGPPALATMLNTYFKADFSRYPSARDAAGLNMCPQREGDQPIYLLNTNGRDRWLWIQPVGGESDERPRPLTEAETIAKIRRGLMVPDDIDIEIINEATWRMTRSIAASFRHGRLFLVGDAAHRFPPFGGFGMNSGIQDVHNLAWKIAFVLQGKAGEELLDSYDVERRPIAHGNADLAMVNVARSPHVGAALCSRNRDRIRFWMRDAENHIHSIGHTLGFVYDEGALIPDGTTPPSVSPRYYTPTDRPGSRFPHFWMDEAKSRSTLDLFDQNLVLIVTCAESSWVDAARSVSERLSVPIDIHVLAGATPEKGFFVGPAGAALVRPDGVTAWRIGWESHCPIEDLEQAVRQILKIP
jgi:2-polyprenyl-6-methoxyphenol hydroxylase-like FAD-dependent oxidoreductase